MRECVVEKSKIVDEKAKKNDECECENLATSCPFVTPPFFMSY